MIKEINEGKYNLLLYCIVFFIIFYILTKEHMFNVGATNTIIGGDIVNQTLTSSELTNLNNLINQVYITDVVALRNLCELSDKLTKNKLTIPGNLTVTGNLNVQGNSAIQNADLRLGNVNINQWIFHAPTDGRTEFYISRIKRDNVINWGNGVNIMLSRDGNTNSGGVNNIIPQGIIISWNGSVPPPGWLLCNGLDGTPNLSSRFILASGQGTGLTNRTINQTGGEENVTLTVNQIPSHTHQTKTNNKYWTRKLKHGGSNKDVANKTTITGTTDSTGGNVAHNNMPPFYVLAYIMKA